MGQTPTIMWPGQSGSNYKYWIYPLGTSLKEEAGNYIFAKETQPNRWTPCYVGQTKNLNERLEGHEKQVCAERHGATHIHAHTSSQEESNRRAEESDLVQRWRAPCNK